MKIQARRPFNDSDLQGHQESDYDYVMNNLEAAVALLDKELAPPPAKGDPMLDHVLKVENLEFTRWREALPSKYWARYDLAACRIGWEGAMAKRAETLHVALEAALHEAEKVIALRAFAQAMFDAAGWPEGGDIDGFTFQDLAVKHGLLVPHTVTAPCGEGCACAEYHSEEDMSEGVTCYRTTRLLSGTKEEPA